MTVRHPGRAHDLRLSKKLMDKKRREFVKQNEKKKHYQSTENETGDGRGDHWHNHFRPNTGIPFDDRPISFCSRERCAAETADQRVTRARRQAKPPCGHVPDERGQHRAEHRPHRDNFGVDQAFADG